MLVIISDLHLTDGTSGATISPAAFEIFVQELRDAAISASWRTDGKYRPVDRVDLVLLGDCLDVIRSARWLDASVRPWDSTDRPEMVELVTKITSDILVRNESSLNLLRNLATPGQFTIPAADRRGRPASGSAVQPVGLVTRYMVGNHDWFYHLPGRGYELSRQAIVRQLGLANSTRAPFPHDPIEDGDLTEVLRRHRVMARHGDIFDPINFGGDRKQSSLGDAIVIELLNRFSVQVERELGDELSPATILGLRELDNIRPLLMAPVWIDGLLARTCPLPHGRMRVKEVWDELVDRFLALAFVRMQQKKGAHNLVDRLAEVLKFSKRVPIGWASKIAGLLGEMRGQQDESYYRHSLAEPDFRSRRAKYVIYGHTHYAENVPLEASYVEGYALNQVYFNSGTWRRTLRLATAAPSEHEFVPADMMTYLVFFQGDERGGRPYETWTGTLGVAPAEAPQMRVDQPRQSPASMHSTMSQTSSQPSSSESTMPAGHGLGPHFAGPTVSPRVVPTRRGQS
jgi:hypothetical protein